jgi:hypothetical protein
VIKMELWKVRGYRFRLESSVIKNRIWLIKWCLARSYVNQLNISDISIWSAK